MLDILIQYKLQIVALLFLAWLVYALHRTGKLKIRRRISAKPPAALVPIEQKLSVTEAELQRTRRENERLTLLLAEMKRKQIEKEIEETAEKQVQAILPEKIFLFDPENQPVGRPIYFLGGIPAITKREELNRIIETTPTLKLLSKISFNLTKKLADYLYFKGDTIYFYTANLLPNGNWCITATSKPPKKTRRHLKMPRLCKTYILLSSQQRRIDDLILNKWEVVKAGAAIHLAATMLGPFPVEEYAQIKRNVGWTFGEGEETQKQP